MEEPFKRFQEWFSLAQGSENDATAMTLATVDAAQRPSARIVLLKQFDESGFVFYTNKKSRKGLELITNPYVALCFHWPSIGKQVRIEGCVEDVSEEDADTYFAQRPRLSQIGAWASKQASVLGSVEELDERVKCFEKKFEGQDVPRPKFWGGYRVRPSSVEFWSFGEFRLHDRDLYYKKDAKWVHTLLYP